MKKYLPILLILILALCACEPEAGSTPPPGQTAAPEGELTILAASSLTQAFEELGRQFHTLYPDVQPVFTFAGSQQLVQQISEGAPADVFAAANQKSMDPLIGAELVDAGQVAILARNQLVVVLPAANPANLTSLPELARPGLRLVLADAGVPVGQYSVEFLEKAPQAPGFDPDYSARVLANVVSYENNVRQVLAKVVLGEADAGIVYTTDLASPTGQELQRLEIPADLNVIASYPIAPLVNAPNPAAAQTWVEFVLSPAGQQILAQFGFLPAVQP